MPDPHRPSLRGPRVVLRPGSGDDVEPLRALLAEPSVARWWGTPYDADELRAELVGTSSSAMLVVEAEGRVVGGISFTEQEDPEFRSAAIDVFLGGAHQGRGLGPEAVRVLARWLVTERGHHRLTIDPDLDNERAVRAYRRVGFRPVGVLRRYRRRPDGTYADGLLLDLLAEELEPEEVG